MTKAGPRVQDKCLTGTVEGHTVKLVSVVSGTTSVATATLPPHGMLGSQFQSTLKAALKEFMASGRPLSLTEWPILMEDSGQVVTLSVRWPVSAVATTLEVGLHYHGLEVDGRLYFDPKSLDVVKQVTSFSGLELVMNLTEPEKALTLDAGGGSPDILLSFRVGVNRPLPAKPPARITMEVSSRSGGILDFPSDDRQIYDPKTGRLVLQAVKEGRWTVQRPVTELSFQAFLSPTVYEPTEDAEMKRIAKKVVGHEINAWKAAKRLTEWVYRYITHKGYAVGFASAKEVLKGRQGDCTEHAVLLGALCKAAGIPARTVVGLVGQGEWFLYHMWVEVYVGEWVAVDAALNQAPVDLWHIKWRDGLLDESGFFRMGVAMLPLLNNLQLRVMKSAFSPP